jgi:putative methyltransferase (TIGR04325 family)
MVQEKLRRLAVGLLPPIVAQALRGLRRRLRPPAAALEYLPNGWDETLISCTSSGWEAESVVEATRVENVESCRRLRLGGPLGTGHQHNLHVSFAYVLARAARGKTSLSVLDWGGGLGYYYYVAREALPEVAVDYHCKETEVLAAAGRQTAPKITWYVDESCLGRGYDVVMLSGSLQYARDWEEQLRRIAKAATDWLYITRLPIVERVSTFAAVQRVYGSVMLHWQFNRQQVLAFVESLGFAIEREFEIGDRPYVIDAPEECELRGWLFRRSTQRRNRSNSAN